VKHMSLEFQAQSYALEIPLGSILKKALESMKIEVFPTEYTSNIRTLPYYTTKAYLSERTKFINTFTGMKTLKLTLE